MSVWGYIISSLVIVVFLMAMYAMGYAAGSKDASTSRKETP